MANNIVIGTLIGTIMVSLIGNVLLYERYSPNRPLVRVGNTVITKKDYQDAADQQTQGAILKKMVFADLIRQAATKAGVMPTEKDVDDRIAFINRTKPETLDAAYHDAGRMAQMRDDLKTSLALENLRVQGVSVSDAEVADFYAHNKQSFALPTQVKMTAVVVENSVDASTAAALLAQNTPMDVIARQPRLNVVGMDGFNPDFRGLPPAVNQNMTRQVFSMKPGDVKVISLGKQFLVVKAKQNAGAGVPPLSQIKGQVSRFARLQKAPSADQEIAKLYHNTNVTFTVNRYASYFSNIQNGSLSNFDKTTASPP